MNREEAYRILGARIGDSQKTIKEKYRSLITQVHPDVQPEKDRIGNYSAQEINDAYTLLIRKGEWVRAEEIKDRASTGAYTYSYRSANQHSSWNEPVNPLAYLDRNVYQYAEDADGERFGMITVARGKYYWNPEEEEFSLFLMSLKDSIVERTGRKDTLLEREIMQKHSEIMYLLAQEFIDYAVCLD
ncbi:MAG: J domain-containing protein, partial [Clostridiales bacterium]|nr:J domain-containing protein [Candidatus Blautia equi]